MREFRLTKSTLRCCQYQCACFERTAKLWLHELAEIPSSESETDPSICHVTAAACGRKPHKTNMQRVALGKVFLMRPAISHHSSYLRRKRDLRLPPRVTCFCKIFGNFDRSPQRRILRRCASQQSCMCSWSVQGFLGGRQNAEAKKIFGFAILTLRGTVIQSNPI